ncbi:hypothetical protein C0J52_26164 [Blattella germanica]|nr:hypothetical protein C0J52_26164 [Blattella germanica]
MNKSEITEDNLSLNYLYIHYIYIDELLRILNKDTEAEVFNPPKKRATSKAISTIDSKTTGKSHLPLGAITDKKKVDVKPEQELQVQDEVSKNDKLSLERVTIMARKWLKRRLYETGNDTTTKVN